MADYWDGLVREKFTSKVKEAEKTIKIPRFQFIAAELKEYEIEIPESYDDGFDVAIQTLAKIQKYRDILVSTRIDMIDKRNLLNKLWHTARSSFLVKDESINEMRTVIRREAAIKMMFSSLFNKKELANDNVSCLTDLTENAIAKFSVCSRQITLMELQVKLGEVESKRRWTKKEER